MFNLNAYRCGGCGWEGFFWEGKRRGWKNVLLAPSTLARVSILLIAFATVLYAISFMGGGSGKEIHEAEETRSLESLSAPQAVEAPPLIVPSAIPPALQAVAPQPQEKTPTGAVSAAKPKIRVVGNRDSKRYHLPGMKYYEKVKEYHRVEFSSEEEAIAAGYHKAPR